MRVAVDARIRAVASLVLVVACSIVLGAGSLRAQPPVDSLTEGLRPFWQAISGAEPFRLTGAVEAQVGNRSQHVELDLVRYGDTSFDLSVTHNEYAFALRRRADATALGLPKHNVVYCGTGSVEAEDHLGPTGLVARLLSPRSQVSFFAPIVLQTDPRMVAAMLAGLLNARLDAATGQWAVGNSVTFRFPAPGSLELAVDQVQVRLNIAADVPAPPAVDDWSGMRVEPLSRAELERQLVRGARRALEILAPSTLLTDPAQLRRQVPHGELRWVDGQRVALLRGTPEEVGRAHGELLREEAYLCVDSVLYTFGTVQTIRSGRWFRHELDAAYARLKPHIPERHLVETRAMAEALGVDTATAEAVNVFPEMFHCSGFALFGKATRDGKLYHGRVLDYMTAIGLQDAATTFIVHVDGQIPFANVGYAGFVGSVSGMNADAISLGEMGGRGEGDWDGVPMATLMRRALEECRTLDDVMDLWSSNPRTCEYYYVFADGKTNRAVGVAAVPSEVEFIHPGQSHERLGEGIEDAVVLSAGDRLARLRERVQSRYGEFDAESGQWLMSRPVAMESNLHNVLFVPQDGILYVANADHKHCAAERPYARLDLKALLAEMPGP
ncbi:MAG: C45 family autoproteolytic acyltransferase/hydrolase [Pirellulaceae bacterium]|jgi:hypothetical protein|nr:C45 family autoproteolytic acyltransferase/hydrolase [Pirellulaceae bacterium]